MVLFFIIISRNFPATNDELELGKKFIVYNFYQKMQTANFKLLSINENTTER